MRDMGQAQKPNFHRIRYEFTESPFCPCCDFPLYQYLPFPYKDYVWITTGRTPIYKACPKCGTEIDWSDFITEE